MKQTNFKLDDDLAERASRHVDGVHYRSVGQILNIALAQWLVLREFASVPSMDLNDIPAGSAPVEALREFSQGARVRRRRRPRPAKATETRQRPSSVQDQATSREPSPVLQESLKNLVVMMLMKKVLQRDAVPSEVRGGKGIGKGQRLGSSDEPCSHDR
jgi:hypothetical protein